LGYPHLSLAPESDRPTNQSQGNEEFSEEANGIVASISLSMSQTAQFMD
jgi:hypothetical protein